MNIPAARSGSRLAVNKKQVEYSFWPTKVGAKGNASLIHTLFSLDPWAIIDLAIKKKCPAAAKAEAQACMRQARDFYEGATETGKPASKPLSLYYCLMNLAKALCLTRGTQATFDKAQHGLSEQIGAGGKELIDAYLDAYPTYTGGTPPILKLQNFSELMAAISGTTITTKTQYNIPKLLPQILPGHRLWAYAAGAKERFVSLHEIEPMISPEKDKLWLNILLVADDLTRLGVSIADFLNLAGLHPSYQQVQCDRKSANGRPLICLEQITSTAVTTTKYANYLKPLFDSLRKNLWVTVSSIPPYRRYYAYLCPIADQPELLPQLLSIYAVSYYLGSITRYRPHHFDSIVSNDYGPRVLDFISGQPLQYLYLMASEFAGQEISKPSIL